MVLTPYPSHYKQGRLAELRIATYAFRTAFARSVAYRKIGSGIWNQDSGRGLVTVREGGVEVGRRGEEGRRREGSEGRSGLSQTSERRD